MKKKISQSKMVKLLSTTSIVMVILYCLATILIDLASDSLTNAYDELYYLTLYADGFGDASGEQGSNEEHRYIEQHEREQTFILS